MANIPRMIVSGKTVLTLRSWALRNGLSVRTAHNRWVLFFKDETTITMEQAKVLAVPLRKRKVKE